MWLEMRKENLAFAERAPVALGVDGHTRLFGRAMRNLSAYLLQ